MKKDETLAPDGSEKIGNTNQSSRRINAAKLWCFTYNNYNKTKINELISLLAPISSYYFAEELAPTTGTPHLQGFANFNYKCRPIEKIKIIEIHWEASRGSIMQNFTYCSKNNGTKYTNIKEFRTKQDPMDGLTRYNWQNEIIKIIEGPIDTRAIYWYWEPNGNVGKTTFGKHLFLKYNAIMINGKGADMKFLVSQLKDDPKIIIIDMPRAQKMVSTSAIEEIKNGFFMSGKYESTTCCYDPPHLIVFSNSAPDTSTLSMDRWRIRKIEDYDKLTFEQCKDDWLFNYNTDIEKLEDYASDDSNE